MGVLDFLPLSPAGLMFLYCPVTVEVEACAILPLKPLDAYPTSSHSGSPYAAVVFPHHCDDNPTPDISKCFGVGLPTIGGETAGQEFQRGLRLGTHQPVH